jgi:RNA polymerase sigma factor (sigma-70 family)
MDPATHLEHLDWARRLARQLVRDEHLAEDLVQEAWLAARKTPPREPAAARAWFATVLRRLAVQQRRGEVGRRRREQRAARSEAGPSDLRLRERVAAQQLLVAKVMELDQPYRRTVLLRYFQDQGVRTIAANEGVPVDTVKSRLRRAHAQLRRKLDACHGGDGRSWLSALLPVARATPSPLSVEALLTGMLTMSAKFSLLAGAALALATFGALLLWKSPAPDPVLPVDAGAPGRIEASVEAPTSLPAATGRTASLPAGNADRAQGRLAGRVVDGDGRPLGSVQIEAKGWRITGTWTRTRAWSIEGTVHLTETDPNGRFSLPTSIHAVTLRATLAGHRPWEEVLLMDAGQARDLGDLVLLPGHRLAGTVFDRDGSPLDGVEVFLVPPSPDFSRPLGQWAEDGPLVATSDGKGRFTVACLAPGPWRLGFRHPQFRVRFIEGALIDGAAPEELRVTLEPARSVTGHVLGFDGERERGRVIVWAGHATRDFVPQRLEHRGGEIAADGSFTVVGLPPATAAGMWIAPFLEEADLGVGQYQRAGPAVRLEPGPMTLGLNPRTDVTFRAVDGASGQPVTEFSARVSFWFDQGEVLDENGRPRFRFPGGRCTIRGLRAPGRMRSFGVVIDAPGYARRIVSGDVAEDGDEWDFGDLALTEAPGLAVTVIDQATGAPLEHAWVRFDPTEEHTGDRDDQEHMEFQRDRTRRTDARGRALFVGQEGLLGEVTASHPRYGFAGRTVRIQARTTEVRLALGAPRAMGAARVRVLDPWGEPVVGARVEHLRGTGSWPSSRAPAAGIGRRTDGDGVAAFPTLTPGEHRFRLVAHVEGGLPQRSLPGEVGHFVTVEGGSTVELTLQQAPMASVHGRVLMGGQPLGGARVVFQLAELAPAFTPTREGPAAYTDVDGRYELPRVPVGPCHVWVDHPDVSMRLIRAARTEAGPNRIDLPWGEMVIEGRVVNDAGGPVEGATLTLDVATYRDPAAMAFSGSRTTAVSATGDRVTLGGNRPVRTGTDGTFRFQGIQPGVPLTLRAFVPGQDPQVRVGGGAPLYLELDPLAPGELSSDLEFVMVPRGQVQVAFPGRDLDSIYSAQLIWQGDTGVPGIGPTVAVFGDGGRASFSGIVPGPWKLVVMGCLPLEPEKPGRPALVPAQTTHEVMVQVRANETSRVDLD